MQRRRVEHHEGQHRSQLQYGMFPVAHANQLHAGEDPQISLGGDRFSGEQRKDAISTLSFHGYMKPNEGTAEWSTATFMNKKGTVFHPPELRGARRAKVFHHSAPEDELSPTSLSPHAHEHLSSNKFYKSSFESGLIPHGKVSTGETSHYMGDRGHDFPSLVTHNMRDNISHHKSTLHRSSLGEGNMPTNASASFTYGFQNPRSLHFVKPIDVSRRNNSNHHNKSPNSVYEEGESFPGQTKAARKRAVPRNISQLSNDYMDEENMWVTSYDCTYSPIADRNKANMKFIPDLKLKGKAPPKKKLPDWRKKLKKLAPRKSMTKINRFS